VVGARASGKRPDGGLFLNKLIIFWKALGGFRTMNVDLEELKAKVEKEVKELEDRKVALQEQLSHVEAVQKFAEEVGVDSPKAEESSNQEESASGFAEDHQRKEIFGQSFG
jgi:hypothetical protein